MNLLSLVDVAEISFHVTISKPLAYQTFRRNLGCINRVPQTFTIHHLQQKMRWTTYVGYALYIWRLVQCI